MASGNAVGTPPTTPGGRSTTAAFEMRGLTVAYADTVALSRVSLRIPRGELAALAGPPGAGKTTLLRCLLGLLAPRAGELRVIDRSVRQARPLIGYVPQSEQIDWRFPLTLAELVMMGRYRRVGFFRRPGPADRGVVLASLAEVGLERLADQRVAELSLVQRRRALLARALVAGPELLLLDEPFAGSAGEGSLASFEVLEQFCQRGGTVVVATRQLDDVARRFQRVVLLNGLVVADGRPSDVLTASNLRAAYGDHPVWLQLRAERFAVDGHC